LASIRYLLLSSIVISNTQERFDAVWVLFFFRYREDREMKMLRCYAEPSRWNGDKVMLASEEAHHLLHVLRAREGDVVTVFDGDGRQALARMTTARGGTAELTIVENAACGSPVVSITLIQSIVREQRMDLIVQKATELGVSRIIPVQVERTVVRLGAEAQERRRERWQRIALNAAKQCGVGWIPEIGRIVPVNDALKECSSLEFLLVASLEVDAVPLRSAIEKAKTRNPRTIGIAIGPEGDFTPAELAAARAAGAVPVSLGNLVLRTETASIHILSIMKYEFEPAQ